MNSKLVAIFIVLLILIGGGAYAAGVSKGKGDKMATENAAMMKQKEVDTASMKKDLEADAMKKKDQATAMKQAETDAMHKTDSIAPAQ